MNEYHLIFVKINKYQYQKVCAVQKKIKKYVLEKEKYQKSRQRVITRSRERDLFILGSLRTNSINITPNFTATS
jgi:hypothetical protein